MIPTPRTVEELLDLALEMDTNIRKEFPDMSDLEYHLLYQGATDTAEHMADNGCPMPLELVPEVIITLMRLGKKLIETEVNNKLPHTRKDTYPEPPSPQQHEPFCVVYTVTHGGRIIANRKHVTITDVNAFLRDIRYNYVTDDIGIELELCHRA